MKVNSLFILGDNITSVSLNYGLVGRYGTV
jgi:hypothetical protein